MARGEGQQAPKKSAKRKGGKSRRTRLTPVKKARRGSKSSTSQDTPASRNRSEEVPQKFSLSLHVWFKGDSPLYYSPTLFVEGGISALRQTLASMGLEFISDQGFDTMEYYRASILVIERDSISKYMVDTGCGSGPHVNFKKFLDETHGKVEDYMKSSKLIIKIYNEWMLHFVFDESENLQYKYKKFDSFLSSCYERHEREIQCLEKIAEFNDRQAEERDRIMAPRVYLSGDKFDLKYGVTEKPGAYGRYFICNYIQEDENLRDIIPMSRDVIVDAKLQISNMIEKVGVVDRAFLCKRDMVFNGGRINFVFDYGMCNILSDAQRRDQEWVRKESLELQDEVEKILSRSED